ncbi:MAG TPA: hypothetical protein DCY35_02220 [Prolixibacteraceae bacterium]|jgi:hypothetical protein|nr:hypothetical protein [Prolixibacteraceae bacterium]
MHNILHLIFNTGKKNTPKVVLDAFVARFGDSLNIEWHKENDNYEAVFYRDTTEIIAIFSASGELLEQKYNLDLRLVTPPIAHQASAIGELMNLIEIDRQGKIFYEIIARDGMLDRYSVLLEDNGTVLEKRKL